MRLPNPKQERRLTLLVWLGIAFGLVLVAVSCSTDRTVVIPLEIEGATYVGDKACADCHANITRAFPASPHARLHLDRDGMSGQNGCESCHGPGSKHIAQGGRGGLDKFIINPGKNPAGCFQCHPEAQAEFHLPQHHPLTEGKMNCVQCHDPHGLDIMKPAGGLTLSRLNETCAQCHREQTKPVSFDHPAMREECTACHSPHGSVNLKLLTVPDSNLCFRCHAQVQGPGAQGHVFIGGRDHTSSLPFGTCWTSGCHTAVHGSNIHPILLY
ncbi:MAG TPA: cytochrome c3 family protein [Verrucomicrobiae bacterium]|nr:cytochrome c3 family protein [Verrucomicrobiae bacterium]